MLASKADVAFVKMASDLQVEPQLEELAREVAGDH